MDVFESLVFFIQLCYKMKQIYVAFALENWQTLWQVKNGHNGLYKDAIGKLIDIGLFILLENAEKSKIALFPEGI